MPSLTLNPGSPSTAKNMDELVLRITHEYFPRPSAQQSPPGV